MANDTFQCYSNALTSHNTEPLASPMNNINNKVNIFQFAQVETVATRSKYSPSVASASGRALPGRWSAGNQLIYLMAVCTCL